MNTHRGCFCVRFFSNYPAKKLDYSRAHNEEQIIEIHEEYMFLFKKNNRERVMVRYGPYEQLEEKPKSF